MYMYPRYVAVLLYIVVPYGEGSMAWFGPVVQMYNLRGWLDYSSLLTFDDVPSHAYPKPYTGGGGGGWGILG